MPDLVQMKKSVNFFGLDSCLTIHNSNMLDFDYQSISNIDLVFYDSDHKTEPTTNALKRIHQSLNDGAIVCMHDASWDMSKNAISNVSNMFKHIITLNVWCGFAILKKI